jgi:hypothetical protein
MNMKLKGALLGLAAILSVAATNIHAQTAVVFAGSSALYLEMGQAAFSENPANCAWDDGSKTFTLTDSRGGITTHDTANAWVVWTGGTGGCSTVASGSTILVYVSTDSTVGARCFFANPRCTVATTITNNTTPPSGALGISEVDYQASALNPFINGASVAVGASDIRAEDSAFATLRALTTCGTPVVTGSQYLGLGYTNGSTINGAGAVGNFTQGTGSSFNVMPFNLIGNDPLTNNALPGTYVQTPVAVTPELVIVNPTDASGFGSEAVSNITSAQLAGYLDGTYGSTNDVLQGSYAPSAPAYVFVREPLSGTYNIMEYTIVNNQQNQSSMEVGLAAINSFVNNGDSNSGAFPKDHCASGTNPTGGAFPNPLSEATVRTSAGGVDSYRLRVIGTGNMTKAVEHTEDALGFAFWGTANFPASAATAATVKYLPVDNIDPLFQTWTDGLVPTSGNGLLGDVSFAHVRDGSYPIWGEQEFITDPSGAGFTAATNLTAAGVKFLSPTQPDFVPYSQLQVVRSHFAPPGVTFNSPSGANTTNSPCDGSPLGVGSIIPSGGSVGGMVYTWAADGAYNADTGSSCGNIGHRM